MNISRGSLPRIVSLLPILLVGLSLSVHAQRIGIGAGLAIPNDEIAQASTDLINNGVQGAEERASNGYYVELRGRFGGDLALTAAVGYNKFVENRSTYYDAGNQKVELTTSQVMVPISVGADMRLSEGFVVPYLTLEATYNYYYRSFEGGSGGFLPSIKSTGEPRIGAAIGGGLNFDLAVADVSVGARLHVANLLNQDIGETEVYYLQLGTVVYFGL